MKGIINFIVFCWPLWLIFSCYLVIGLSTLIYNHYRPCIKGHYKVIYQWENDDTQYLPHHKEFVCDCRTWK